MAVTLFDDINQLLSFKKTHSFAEEFGQERTHRPTYWHSIYDLSMYIYVIEL